MPSSRPTKDAPKPKQSRPVVDTGPRYQTIANALTTGISSGRYPVGSTLPTEHELCEQFGISRFTVREALRQLLEAGLITRTPRIGTKVIAKQEHAPYVQTLGSLDNLLQYAANTELRFVYTSTIEVDQILADEIPMTLGERWFFGIGIRFQKDDNQPVAITRVYICPDFRDISQRLKDRTDPIYRLIEKHHGVTVSRVEQRIVSVSLSRDDALHLKARAGSPALRMLRFYYDQGDRLIEASDSIHPGDRFSYAMTIDRSNI